MGFRALDDCLRICMDQFTRVSMLVTAARRANVIDSIFLPSDGVKSVLEDLPRLGSDLFAGKFQEVMESEAKRIQATEKINLSKPAQRASARSSKVDQTHRPTTQHFPRRPLRPFRQPDRASSTSIATTYPTPTPTRGRGRGSRRGFTPRSKATLGMYRGGPWRQ